MAKATPDSITRSSEQLHRGYQRDYAGRARHDCEVAPLERMIEKSRVLLRKARKLKGARGREVEALVTERLKLYRSERDLVAEARLGSAETHRARVLGQLADRTSGVYRRHFAGHDRVSRDLSLLTALIEALDAASGELGVILETERSLDISATKNTVDTQLELMREERFAIEAAQSDLTDEAEKQRLALEANRYLDAYRVHFAGHPRLSCEPQRLRAILTGLSATRDALGSLATSDQDQENLAAITSHIADYEREVGELEAAHAAASLRDRIGQLGTAANRIFALYSEHFAGRPRVETSLRLLSEICDRLGAICDQMHAIDDATEDTANRKNISIVLDRLRIYENEYVEIAKAKQASDQTGDLDSLIRVE